MAIKRIIFILLFCFCSFPAWAANYYISATGSGSNCTSGDPCALATAVASATSGETIFFKSDDTWTNASVATVLSATAGVTYDGSTYGGGTRAKILIGHETAVGHTAAVSISANNVTFKGFEVDGDSNSYNTYGIYIGENVSSGTISNITIDNCVIHHVGKDDWTYGILVSSKGASGTKISNVSITNTTVYNSYHEGIAIYPSWTVDNQQVDGVLIRGCTLYNNLQGVTIVNDSKNVTLEYNNIYNNTGEGLWVRISPDQPDNVHAGPTDVVVRYNIFQNNVIGIYITNGMGFLETGSFYGNLIYNNQPVSSGSSGFNISIHGNDTTPSFNSSVFNFYNNTIFSNRDAGSFRYSVAIGAYTNNITNLSVNFKNNIVYDANNIPVWDRFDVLTHSNNLIYRSSANTDTHVQIASTAYDRDGTASDITNWEATAQKTDPAFSGGTLPTGFSGTYGTNMVPNTDYFQLTVDSDAKDTGATLASYTGAINGAGLATPIVRPLGAAYDIGAYEYGTLAQTGGNIFSGVSMKGASCNTAAAAKSCATDSTLLLTVDSTDGSYNIGWASTKIYTGQAAFNPSDLGGNATVCKVEFNIRQIAGTGSDISAKARIFNMSSTSLGTDPSGTCTSNTKTVTGSYPIGYTPAFDGLACDVDSGSTYGITLARADGSYDAENYIQIFVKQTSAITGYAAEWASDKSRTNDDSAFDISMKIYGFLR